VGDTHQQIYSWRYAVNSLEQVDFPDYSLSNSFRFDAQIAELAKDILNWKSHFKEHHAVQIKGSGHSKGIKTRATIARTNLSLLIRAIDFMHAHKKPRLYFEGNINSYTYADEGASLYDVFNLYFGKTDLVRDPLLRSLNGVEELKDYIEQTEDHELAMLLDVIDEYGKEVPKLIQMLKDCHVADGDKHKADMVFSTVHRSKGMEYDEVTLASDFITEEKILKMVKDTAKDKLNIPALNEEVNLLYVAATRTRNLLNIPEELAGKKDEPHIQSIAPASKKEERPVIRSKASAAAQSSKPAKAAPRKEYTNAYQPWTDELDEELTRLFRKNWDEYRLAEHFGRNPGAISSRIKRLELYEKYR
jgi:superfamily I DNA/RNA helicase